MRYISPYHECPIDLDKLEEETSKAGKPDTAQGGATCRACERDRRNGDGKEERHKTAKRPSGQRLASGSAANFEIFGNHLSGTAMSADQSRRAGR